MTGIVSGEA